MTYLDSIIHWVRYNNVPLAGHCNSAGKLEMTISTSGRAKPEAEGPIHVKHLLYKQIKTINDRFPEQIQWHLSSCKINTLIIKASKVWENLVKGRNPTSNLCIAQYKQNNHYRNA